MKKIIFASLLCGLAIQSGVFAQDDDFLYRTIQIPTYNPVVNSSKAKNIIIEQNDVVRNNYPTEVSEENIEKEDVLRKPAYAVGNIYYPIMSMLGKYKNEIKTVFTDIDGILVPENYANVEFRDGIYKSVKNLKSHNIPLIFTTGRTFREAKRVSEVLDLNSKYYITQNGAEIENADGEIIYEKPIDKVHLYKVYCELKSFNYIYTQDIKIAFYRRGQVYVFRNSNIPDLVDVPVVIDRFSDLPKDIKISKIRIYGKDAHNLDIFKRYLRRHYSKSLNIQDVAQNFFDINIKDATKENAVRYLAENLGVNIENAAAFGYSREDVGLMDYLRQNGGLAISTEASMQEVKDASSYITKDVEHDGFTFAIDTILGNNLILKSDK